MDENIAWKMSSAIETGDDTADYLLTLPCNMCSERGGGGGRFSCMTIRIKAISHTFRSIDHDDVIKWQHFPRYWPFVRGIHRSPVNSPHKGQWREALVFSLICAWINGWVKNREAGDLRRHRANYDVQAMNALYILRQFIARYGNVHYRGIHLQMLA